MLELHYPIVTKTILERQYPGKPTLKVAFGNSNGAIFENSSKLRASLFATSRWPRSSVQTNYHVHPPPSQKFLKGQSKVAFCNESCSKIARKNKNVFWSEAKIYTLKSVECESSSTILNFL